MGVLSRLLLDWRPLRLSCRRIGFARWAVIADANPNELLDSLGIHSHTVRVLVTVIALLGVLSGGLKLLWSLIKWFRTALRRRRLDPEDLQRLNYRRLFARHVANRIGDLDNKEEWADHRFAELEAEVETMSEERQAEGLARLLPRRSGLRREKSLSRALRRSRDPLVLLQGDPGSGKSVALRFVTRRMAEEAMRAESLEMVIPLYINLKALQPGPVDPQRIHDFVIERLSEGTDRDVQSFLENYFVDGLRQGAWLFLFDSFDEIPEVLSATEGDETVYAYSEAIIGFMHGMNQCRGVIASRSFRAPARRDLPRYRIVPLSERRRRELIEKANLAPAERDMLLVLPSASPDLIALTENPMFLGLLCEYIRGRSQLPAGWHEVFEAYVSRRLGTDAGKLEQLFGIGPGELRRHSEQVAFTMTASAGMGLSPTREDLVVGYKAAAFADSDRLGVVMDALEWSKLARSETPGNPGSRPTFTFAHRRFQEYFATCVVLRESERVTVRNLLTDGAWRETVVTLFQAQEERATELIAEAGRLVEAAAGQLDVSAGRFTWPHGLLHILNLLQNGCAGRTERLPADLQERVAVILQTAFEHGTLTDRKWALEVAGTAPPRELAELLRLGFRGPNSWLRDVASRQAARLREIPADLAGDVRAGLVLMLSDGRLAHEWFETRAQLQRLHPAPPFVRTAELLRIVPLLDALALAVMAVLAVSSNVGQGFLRTIVPPALAVVAGFLLRPMIAPLARRDPWNAFSGIRDVVGATVVLKEFFADRGVLVGPGNSLTLLEVLWDRGVFRGAERSVALSEVLVYLGVYCRGFLAVTAVSLSATGQPRWWLVVVGVYLVSWSPTAVLAARMGALKPTFFLPFPALLLLVAAVRWVRARSLVLLLIVVAGFVLAVACGALAVYGGLWLLDQGGLVVVGLLVITGIAVLVPAWDVVSSVRDAVRDRAWYRRWQCEEQHELTSEGLLEVLIAQSTIAGVERVIRDVRKRRLLADADDGDAVVRDLLVAVEHGPAGDGATWSSLAMADWWASADDRTRDWLASQRGTSAHDELGQLLEDLQRSAELPTA